MIKKYVTGEFQTNTYLIINDGRCVVIDPGLGFENAALEIITNYTVEKILITHGHLDHIDGIRYLDAPIYISKHDASFLEDSANSLYKFINKPNPLKVSELKVHTLKDGDTIDVFGSPLEVIHTPGHTKGSLCFLYNNNLFSGDTLFNESVGRTDFPTGNFKDMEKSIYKLLTTLDNKVKVYPGHDDVTTISHEKKNNLLYIEYKKRIS